MHSCRFTLVTVLASALAGCFTVTSSSSFTQKELAKKADVARANLTTRADVHRLLGEPWISSERWQVEVYRKTGNYRELLVTFGLLPFPIPAPIPMPKQDMTGYTLVSYSAAGVVEAVDTAVSKYPEPPLARIQAGDFAFTERQPSPGAPNRMAVQVLMVSHERFAASGIGTDVQSCRVLVGCSGIGPEYSPIALQLDDDTSRGYVLAGSVGRYPLLPLTLEPGAHTLQFSAEGQAGLGRVSTQFTCQASQLQYAIARVGIRTSFPIEKLFWPVSRFEGTANLQNEVPVELKDSGVLLWSSGQWLVEN